MTSSMHLDEELVQRVLHDELASTSAAAVRAHVAACGICSARLAEARQEEARLFQLLRHLDPPPRPAAHVVIAARSGTWPVPVRWAAGVLLALAAAGAAYAAPGSPLPGLLDRVWRSEQMTGAPRTAVSPDETEPVRGIAVAPGDRLLVHFIGDALAGVVTVSVGDGTEVVVRARNGPATFQSEPSRLVIEAGGANTSFEVELPRDARFIEIRVGERRLLRFAAGRVTTREPNAALPLRLPLSPDDR